MMTSVAPSQSFSLEEILAPLPTVRVAVFGDFCLDAYWWIDPSEAEKSVETGLPRRRVCRQHYSLGGAGNIVANLIGLGVRNVKAIGSVGADPFGQELLRLLREMGADTSGMVVLPDHFQTMVYAKPYRGEQEENRLDFGAANTLSDGAIDSLIAALEQSVTTSDVVVLNQQVALGISTPEVIARINRIICDNSETTFVADARHLAALYRGAILKLNANEATQVLGEPPAEGRVTTARAKTYAQDLCRSTGQPVFLTRGDHGIVVADGEALHEIPGIQIIGRIDPVGAGDTTVAALAAVIGIGGDALAAAKFANIAASITVRKLQTTGTATPEEIRLLGAEPDYVYMSDLAEDFRLARFVEDTEIEVIGDSSVPEGLCIQHAIFDHDGTLSTLREGWERIMEPMMVRAILGPQYESADASFFDRVRGTVRDFIDKTTGVQTLVQMQGLVQMVRQFGFVPQDQILDEHGYKKIFNEELLFLVHQRVEKLEREELAAADFQIKNAGPLLESLHGCGVKLYLVSGTDEVDVRAEAKALGYADLFEGRIFGGVGDVKVEAKKMVLERIIRQHGLSGHEFVTFGDGPVEMRETRKRGGICVGVASDEVRGFGLNLAKRARLIRAGAEVIVPDFSQLPPLLWLLRLG